MNNFSKKHGLFCMNELITTDLDSAREFYSELLGWSFTETKTIYGNSYLVIHKENTYVGGMMLKDGNVDDDIEPCWDPYVCVDDIEVSVERVKELGGKVVIPPTDIPETGQFCGILDPQGIYLNLIMYTDNK